MRKLFFTALAAVTLATSAFAAGTEKVSHLVLKNFASEFTHASNVSWSITEDYVKASFIANKTKMQAFYTPNGDFIGTSTAISLDDLTTRVKRTIAKKFSGYTVKEVIRFDKEDHEGAYFVSAENEKESLVIKVGDYDQVNIYKKFDKQ